MKKTILVMGAICMPAMAFAQNSNSISESSVRIYGVGDLGIAHYKTAGKSKTAMHSASAGSRLGFLFSEDLGQGLKVNARLEAGINMDDGTSSSSNGLTGRFWSRQAYIELENKAWGHVRMGRLEGPIYTFFPKFDPMLMPAMDAWGVLTTLGARLPGTASGTGKSNGFLINPTQRTDNTIGYASPKWNGFQTKVAYSFNEGQKTRPKLFEWSVDYFNGPLTLGALLVKASKTPGEGTTLRTDSVTEYALGASYRSGPVQPFLTYIHRNKTDPTLGANGAVLNGNSESVKLAGAIVPVSERGNVRITFGKYSSGSPDSDAKSYGVAYTYDVSKSMTLLVAATRLTQGSASKWPVFQSPVPDAGKPVNGFIVGTTVRF